MTQPGGAPPSAAVRLVDLFAPAKEAESILGDLLEEFSQLASKSGIALARQWYWRQTIRTIAHLSANAFYLAPWSTIGGVVGGFFLLRFAFRFPEWVIFAVLEKYQVFEHHFTAYAFFASTGIDLGLVIISILVGCAVAVMTNGREMIATVGLTLLLAVLAGVAILASTVREQPFFVWTLPWQFVDWAAIVVGGVMIRIWRSAGTARSQSG
jgi:hypothetical protein